MNVARINLLWGIEGGDFRGRRQKKLSLRLMK